LGGLEESATGILGEMSKPMSWGMPATKICEKLKKMDGAICELRFGKRLLKRPIQLQPTTQSVSRILSILHSLNCSHLLYIFPEKTIDLKTVDLKKLKVRDLKKILSGWDEDCDGCIEKSDFIKRIEALKPKYVRSEL